MLYKFKSKAAGDLIMLEPNGRQVLQLIGKQAGATGIIETAHMPAAIQALEAAIVREKRLKEWRRAWKIELIEAQNEDWGDLGVGLGLAPLPPVPTKESMT